jgi:hypothetical protein
VSILQGQTKKSSDSTTFSIQVDYLSNYSYNGRVDSIKYPYQTTTASLHLANGLFSNFSASYLLTPGMKGFDFFELDLGYEYKIGKKIYGEIYGSKYFYSGGSNLINGNISSDIGASFNYDFTYFQFNNLLDVFFTNKSDIQFTPGVEKTIYFGNADNSSWSINPYLYCNFSTVNYYESNVTRRLNGPRGPRAGPAIGPQLTSITVVQNKGFKLLNTDFSMPLSYENTHWLATFTPTYSIPFNKIETISTNTITSATGTTTNKVNSTPYSELHLNNQFFFQIGVTYKF